MLWVGLIVASIASVVRAVCIAIHFWNVITSRPKMPNSAAAIATGAPPSVQIAFLICLGLFVAALADGVAEHRSRLRN